MKIAFYSYKGGVGRTKIMVGVGALLAWKGFRVGMLDFDLDASGLTTIFQENLENVGSNELLHILKYPSLHLARINNAMLDKTDFVATCLGPKQIQRTELKYLPTVSNPDLSTGINLNELDVSVHDLLDRVYEDFRFDWLLIDVKPGYSPSASVILPKVDCVVVVARIDSQNIEGLKRVIPNLVNKDLRPVIVANMVPNSNQTDAYLKRLERACKKSVDVCIDYDPNLIFDDDIGYLTSESSLRLGLDKLASVLLEVR